MLDHVFGRPFRIDAVLANLYDACLCDYGRLHEHDVRSVGVRGATVDPRTLSVSLPADVIELLGLDGVEPGGRLSPIRLTIRDRSCCIDPFRSDDNIIVVGHVPLTAFGLMLDPGGRVVDDPYPTR